MRTLTAQVLEDKITIHHNSDWSGSAYLHINTRCAAIQVAIAGSAILDLARKVHERENADGDPKTAGNAIIAILRALRTNDKRTAALSEVSEIFCDGCGIELHGETCHCRNDE